MGSGVLGGATAQPVADPDDRYGVRDERLLTGATVITAVRTIASVVLATVAFLVQRTK